LVFGLFGRIPRSGELTTVDHFKFRVEKMKGSRILNIHLTLLKRSTSSPLPSESQPIKSVTT
jgi:putative hemolysin